MNKSFDMTMKNEDIKFLRRNYPNAFILMFEIMDVYERRPGKKLNIGEAYVGDYETYGMKRKQYRYALDKLVELGHIGIIRTTNKGTIVCVLNDKIICRNIPKEIMQKHSSESKILEILEEENFLEEKIAMGQQRGHQKNEFRATKSMSINSETSTSYDVKENSLGHQENEFGATKGATCLYSIKEEESLNKKKTSTKKKKTAAPMKISFDFEKGIINISESKMKEWKKKYPYADIPQVLKKMHEFVLADPKKNMYSCWSAAINTWLKNNNDRNENISKVEEHMKNQPTKNQHVKNEPSLREWIKSKFRNGQRYNQGKPNEVEFNFTIRECDEDAFSCTYSQSGTCEPGEIKIQFSKKEAFNALLAKFHIHDRSLYYPISNVKVATID